MNARIRRAVVAAAAIAAVAVLVAACGGSGSDLTGKTWQATSITTTTPAFQGMVPPDQAANYTITFQSDGNAAIKADCNNVTATYTTGDNNAITITLGASTMAFCGEASLDQAFTAALAAAKTYEVSGSTLKLNADGGTLELAGK
jgi:heat shock protein HslJ